MDPFLRPDPAAHPELGVLVAAWQDGTREWRENLGRVSREAVCWQPYEYGPSIGGLILHMMDCETWWLRVVADQESDDPNTPDGVYARELNADRHHWPAPPKQPLAWYYALQDARREENLTYVRRHPDPNTLHGGRPDVSYRWIVAHLVQHDSYHGGQAVLLHQMYRTLRKKG